MIFLRRTLPLFLVRCLCLVVVCSVYAFGQTNFFVRSFSSLNYPNLRAQLFIPLADGTLQTPNADSLLIEENGNRVAHRILEPARRGSEQPLSIAFSVDISSSMAKGLPSGLQLAKRGIATTLQRVASQNSQYSVSVFDATASIVTDITQDEQSVLSLMSKIKAESSSSDLTAAALHPVAGVVPCAARGTRKRVTFLFTDGAETNQPTAIIERALADNIVVCIVVLRNTASHDMIEIARQTGGVCIDKVTTELDVEKACATALQVCYGATPCILGWQSFVECDSNKVVKILALNELNTFEHRFNYRAASRKDISIRALNSFVDVGNVDLQSPKAAVFSFKAEGDTILVRNIVVENDRAFRLASPRSFLLPKDSIALVRIEFISRDSSYTISSIQVQSDACVNEVATVVGGSKQKGISVPIKLTTLNGGEILKAGVPSLVQWKNVLPTDSVRLQYTTNNGSSWQTFASAATLLEHSWSVPILSEPHCKVKATLNGSTVTNPSKVIHGGTSPSVSAMSVSPDGSLVAVARDSVYRQNQNGATFVYSTATGELHHVFLTDGGQHIATDFSPDGSLLASASFGPLIGNKLLYVWDVQTKSIVRTIRMPKAGSSMYKVLSFHPTEKVLCVEGVLYSTETWQVLQRLDISSPLNYSPSGKFIAGTVDFGNGEYAVSVYSSNGSLLFTTPSFSYQPTALSFSRDNSLVSITLRNGAVLVVSVATEEFVASLNFPNAQIGSVCFSTTEDVLAIPFSSTNSAETHVKLFDTFTWKEVQRLQFASNTSANRLCAFSSASAVYATYSPLCVWNSSALVADESDEPFAIVKPELQTSESLQCSRVFIGNTKDSVFTNALCNTGSGALTIDSVSVSNQGFSVLALPKEIAANTCADIEIRFTPTVIGINSTRIQLHTTSGVFELQAQGEGVDANASVRTSINFGEVLIGSVVDTLLNNVVCVRSDSLVFTSTRVVDATHDLFTTVPATIQPFTLNETDPCKDIRIQLRATVPGYATAKIVFQTLNSKVPIEIDASARVVCTMAGTDRSVQIPSILSQKAGEEVVMPVRLNQAPASLQGSKRTYTFTLQFNATMLIPNFPVVADTIIGNLRTVQVRNAGFFRSDTLMLLRFTAALGDTDQTPLVLSNFAWDDECSEYTPTNPSVFQMQGVCRANGSRYFINSDSLAIAAIFPNPASNTITAMFSLREAGTTSLQLVSTMGALVQELHSGNLDYGAYKISSDISAIPSGVYMLVLQTPTKTISQRVVIEK